MADNQSIFRNIAQQMPGQNQRVVTGLQEAAKTQMQQQLGGLGRPLGVKQIQQLGAQATAAQAQPLLQVQQQAQQQAGQLGQMATEQQRRDTESELQKRQFQLQRASLDSQKQLANLNEGLKTRLTDEQFAFQKDELGRTIFNERQLLDYKLATAKSDIELKDTEQKMRQASQRRIQILKAAQAKLTEQLKQEFQKSEQELDQEQRKRLTIAKAELDAKIKQAEADARNKGSLISSAFTIAGAFAPVPGGPIVGAMMGQGIGNILYSAFPKI